jgi:hypothetical protein
MQNASINADLQTMCDRLKDIQQQVLNMGERASDYSSTDVPLMFAGQISNEIQALINEFQYLERLSDTWKDKSD